MQDGVRSPKRLGDMRWNVDKDVRLRRIVVLGVLADLGSGNSQDVAAKVDAVAAHGAVEPDDQIRHL